MRLLAVRTTSLTAHVINVHQNYNRSTWYDRFPRLLERNSELLRASTAFAVPRPYLARVALAMADDYEQFLQARSIPYAQVVARADKATFDLTHRDHGRNPDGSTWRRRSHRRYYVKARPGAVEFLDRMRARFELYVYTAGTRAYAEQILTTLLDQKGDRFRGRVISSASDTPELVRTSTWS